jgi:pseudaminic acid biosynthesis-associated methylase
MQSNFQTDQEKFWAGEFGDAYIRRNTGAEALSNTVALFSAILSRCPGAESLIEFGANTGINLHAIRALNPSIELDAIEINENAVAELRRWNGVRRVHHRSILNFEADQVYDVALIKGVLIHINPECLGAVYDSLFNTSRRYIVVAEYFNSTPVEVNYRGHAERLFKRDFAGELLDRFESLRVVDYGFVWRRDPAFPQDDLSWFVLEKRPPERTPLHA